MMKDLSIDSELFSDFREAFDAVLRQTITDMAAKDVDEAQVGVKFGIQLQPTRDENGNPASTPLITFTLGNQITTKMKTEGAIHCGDGSYILFAPGGRLVIQTSQMSFDDLAQEGEFLADKVIGN